MRGEDSDLLVQLQRAWAQDVPWQGFLRALMAQTGARDVHLLLRSGDSEEGALEILSARGEAMALQVDILQRLRYLRVYTGDDYAAAQPFRAIRTRADGGGEAWLIVQRAGADFPALVSARLSGLAPHIAVAAAQYWAGAAAKVYAAQMDSVLQRLGIGWVALSASGAAVAASAGLGQSLIAGGRLRLAHTALRRVLDAQSAYRSGQAPQPAAWQDAGLQFMLQPADMGRAVLYVQSAVPARSAAQCDLAAQMLASMAQLTPAEARFAVQLAQGCSIAEAGAALSLSVETARHYSKQVYSKMGLPSQTAVVRRIDNSVLRLM